MASFECGKHVRIQVQMRYLYATLATWLPTTLLCWHQRMSINMLIQLCLVVQSGHGSASTPIPVREPPVRDLKDVLGDNAVKLRVSMRQTNGSLHTAAINIAVVLVYCL